MDKYSPIKNATPEEVDDMEVDAGGASVKGKRFAQLKNLMKKAKPVLKEELLKSKPVDNLTDEDKKMLEDLSVER